MGKPSPFPQLEAACLAMAKYREFLESLIGRNTADFDRLLPVGDLDFSEPEGLQEPQEQAA